MDENARMHAYLALRHGDQLAPAAFARAIQSHGSVEALLASAEHAHLANGITHPARATRGKISAELRWAEQQDHRLLTYESPDYPSRLRSIASPPPVLAVRGNPKALQQPQLAVVGSRRCSAYGEEMARWLAFDLAGCGLAIISGLARGIDTRAHQGALAAGGTSIAVLATGLDQIYPRGNAELAELCCDCGALVSEFPLGTPPLPPYFPQRNRIISGLSQGVLVVEATLKSGSLITARLAMEQNRDVFAVPGQINRAFAQGCHQLIKTGAKLVEQPGDILTELSPEILEQLTLIQTEASKSGQKNKPSAAKGVDGHCRAILNAVKSEDLSFDVLQERCRLPTETLGACLLQLELQGLVCHRDGRIGRSE